MPIQGAELDENGKKIRYKGLGYFRKDKQTYCIQDGKIFRCVPIPPKNQVRHEYIELYSDEIEALNLNGTRANPEVLEEDLKIPNQNNGDANTQFKVKANTGLSQAHQNGHRKPKSYAQVVESHLYSKDIQQK
ncbi:hypothetical protein LOTGIDRAFT_234311 [Lottia gigantea]|uniref:Uncharacterized protein n=1 Tax=Lottia gigantea TaxID=225164 RepID=V3ZYL5_LOTGI|nr:hypothetical protein LOTGIDRAFT_234311 [Lottia gigantea]ESO89477.1 hypothetical protein LOTGIDRAFT_234311 [Lottia gigantea]